MHVPEEHLRVWEGNEVLCARGNRVHVTPLLILQPLDPESHAKYKLCSKLNI